MRKKNHDHHKKTAHHTAHLPSIDARLRAIHQGINTSNRLLEKISKGGGMSGGDHGGHGTVLAMAPGS